MDQRKAIQLIKEYVQFLIEEKHYVIKQAILFGSYAKGSYHEDSDIDIAIVLEDLGDSFDEQLRLMTYRREFDVRIEPHPFDEARFDEQSPFAYEIIKTGIRIL
ncbi:MAG TPA: nucleotidyltransferase domain-containing protein [Spirochaetes bacterium]|nr:nucleotidyltransferase domain-containing protein [Spirochaetota bacterium]